MRWVILNTANMPTSRCWQPRRVRLLEARFARSARTAERLFAMVMLGDDRMVEHVYIGGDRFTGMTHEKRWPYMTIALTAPPEEDAALRRRPRPSRALGAAQEKDGLRIYLPAECDDVTRGEILTALTKRCATGLARPGRRRTQPAR